MVAPFISLVSFSTLSLLDLIPHRCEKQNVRIADEQQRVGGVRVHGIGDSAVDQRHHGTAHDGHHHQCGGELGVVAQIMDSQRPDGGPHDGMREAQTDDGNDGDNARCTQCHDNQRDREQQLDNQSLPLRNHLGDKQDAADITHQQGN